MFENPRFPVDIRIIFGYTKDMDNINERIGVIVKFSNGKTVPIVFDWRGQRHNIKRISLVFDRADGGRRFLCFSVDTGGMIAELVMDRQDFVWRIAKCAQSYI